MDESIFEQEKLTQYIIDDVCSKAIGRKSDICLYNYPHDVYFIGNLRPVDNEANSEEPLYYRDLINKLSPNAFGAEINILPSKKSFMLKINLSWSCYYRVFPTFKQQKKHQLHESNLNVKKIYKIDEEDAEDIEDIKDITVSPEVEESFHDRRKVSEKDSLFIVFKKIPIEAKGIIKFTKSGESFEIDISDLQKNIDSKINDAINIILNDDTSIKTNDSYDEKIKVPYTVLSSENEYNEFIKNFENKVYPEWKWGIRCTCKKKENNYYLLLSLQNESPDQKSPNIENYLFDTKIAFTLEDCEILPFELDLAPKSFRYNRNLWGRGFNCSVKKCDNTAFETSHTPLFKQLKYQTRDTPEAPFEILSKDPVPVLNNIYQSMNKYLEEWERERKKFKTEISDWGINFEKEFDNDLNAFKFQIKKFKDGLELLKMPEVLQAFKLANETFRRAGISKIGKKNKTNWRLFQIVFIVSQLPDIVSLQYPDKFDKDIRKYVDIIYFPTGGGKTEAYLGIVVFHCFYDRLRGKSAGVTSWTRFPLRLLTLQQMQRFADIIGIAELIRQEQTDKRLSNNDVDGFAVGYFVGKESTPNEITPPFQGDSNPTWSIAIDENLRQKWKKISKCPHCQTNSVTLDFDQNIVRLIHRCTNANCGFNNGIIPIYVVDNEIYRYLPSVIVGTIDKLASLGLQQKMSLLFGKIDGSCEIHGYYRKKCCQKNCSNKKLNRIIPKGISGPTLFVQDELHLLKEGLGTFDSHYETFTQQLSKELGNKYDIKVIASSATVEAFERQIEHLYGRDKTYARIFPGYGPSLTGSFYAETKDYPQRIYVGIIPHNKTIFNSILELIQYYHEAIQDLKKCTTTTNPYNGAIQPNTREWFNLLDLYDTSLTYFLSNRELSSIHTDLESAVNTELEQNDYSILNIEELTGSTSTDKVVEILGKLETSLLPSQDKLDTILATNMVSHGVDIDRLNAMIFYGMPRQNAEYIQASSRVGRANIGIVFNCLHPIRDRDQSHYYYFDKYHEYLGRLIEPVAINRWSKFSIQRTLPGLFMAILLQVIAYSKRDISPGLYYRLELVKKEISNGSISPNNFMNLLEESYLLTNPDSQYKDAFKEEINSAVKQFLYNQIIGASSRDGWVSESLIPAPMISLRDVDDPIWIGLDENGTRWANKL